MKRDFDQDAWSELPVCGEIEGLNEMYIENNNDDEYGSVTSSTPSSVNSIIMTS